MTHKASETKGKKPMRYNKVSESAPKDTAANLNNVIADSTDVKEDVSAQTATQIDSLTTISSESVETTDARGSLRNDQKQKDTLDGFIAWDED